MSKSFLFHTSVFIQNNPVCRVLNDMNVDGAMLTLLVAVLMPAIPMLMLVFLNTYQANADLCIEFSPCTVFLKGRLSYKFSVCLYSWTLLPRTLISQTPRIYQNKFEFPNTFSLVFNLCISYPPISCSLILVPSSSRQQDLTVVHSSRLEQWNT